MNDSPSPAPSATADAGAFPLLWAVAMSGHRELPDEVQARDAIRSELTELKRQASQQHARLVAVSSIARGADLIFAEECLAAGLPWKCLLPFTKEEFRKDDFSAAEWNRAEQCIARAYRVETVTPGIPISDEQRDLAYRDCGHRTIEAGDVILILSDGNPVDRVGGAAEMKEYARTLNKPVWHWHVKTGARSRTGWPGEAGGWQGRTLFWSRVTDLIRNAAAMSESVSEYPEEPDRTAKSVMHHSLDALFRRMDHLALAKQGDAQELMRKIVFSHLLATSAAAISVTVVAAGCWHSFAEMRWLALGLALMFSALVLAKPVLAGRALWLDKKLHKLQAQKEWVEARVAAELCRSALTSWRFPQAPLALFSEEDFPHFKRLIRTLRMARELDAPAAATVGEEDPVALYSAARIEGQIKYFIKKHAQAVTESTRWQRRFNVATWTVIILGAVFGIAEASEAFSSVGGDEEGLLSRALHYLGPLAACVLIIGPFYASYALAVLSIRDCRRRSDRFLTLKEFLERQKTRLAKVKSPASRIAVVENTERMLLEELHEWYSVMRAVRV